MNQHPNATVAAAVGLFSVLLTGILGAFGVQVHPILLTTITGLLTALVLFIGRNGLQGVLDLVWHGKGA